MPAKTDVINLMLRVICLHPPSGHCGDVAAKFGLQDKSGDLLDGRLRPDGTIEFEFTITCKQPAEMEIPNLTGSYVHGTPTQRFVYLSLGCRENTSWRWIRRIKVPLTGIAWEQIQSATPLEATIDGNRSGTVELIGKGWQVQEER